MKSIIEICDDLNVRIHMGETISNEELSKILSQIRNIAYEEYMGEDL